MNKIKNALCALAVSALLPTGFSAQAQTFNFTDTYIAFPGYPRNTTLPGEVDEYGDPKIDSMTVTLDNTNNYLQSVVVNIRPTSSLYKAGDVSVRWDSLFINTSYVDLSKATTKDSWDQTWDYFVHSGGASPQRGSSNYTNIVGDVPTVDGLYKVSDTFNYTSDYTTVKGIGRTGHPDGIDKDFLGSKISDITGLFSSFSLGSGKYGYKITYDFSSFKPEGISSIGGIKLGNGFTIGYTPWCANDVFLASAPVPEPATMLLFGTGLAGLAGFTRGRKKK